MVRKAAQQALASLKVEVKEGGIVRGPKDKRQLALVFTGHEYAEGGEIILNELARHKAQALCACHILRTNGARTSRRRAL